MKNFREAENGDLAIVTPVRRCSNSCFSIAYGYEFFYHIPLALGIATGCPCLIFVVASLPHMSIMTRGLVEESGYFRSHPVTVVEQQGNILHFGTLPDYVPSLTRDLLKWAKNSEVHMLIRSCVFHYELEQIHPFADGNGRIGRL